MRNDKSVLVLDAHWRVTNVTTPKKALVDMAKNTATAVLVKGKDHVEPISWEQWILLPVENGEECVHTAHTKILMPKVIIMVNFKRAKSISRTPKLRPNEVRKAYGGRCAYTGELVGKEGTIDHVHPRSRGGANSWDNVVWSSREVNFKKGARTPEEAGLQLKTPIKKVRAKPMGTDLELRDDRPEWRLFVN